IPSSPFNLAAQAQGTNAVKISWQEDADNESGFALERSTDAASWQALGSVGANVTVFTDETATLEQPFFYRVRAVNASGVSRFSNITAAMRSTITLVGGTLTTNTVWSPA